MLVARKLDGTLMTGCLEFKGGGGGTWGYFVDDDVIESEEGGWDDGLVDDDGMDADVLDDLETWVIFALSPWLLASSLIVSIMETVWTWPDPPFIVKSMDIWMFQENNLFFQIVHFLLVFLSLLMELIYE